MADSTTYCVTGGGWGDIAGLVEALRWAHKLSDGGSSDVLQ